MRSQLDTAVALMLLLAGCPQETVTLDATSPGVDAAMDGGQVMLDSGMVDKDAGDGGPASDGGDVDGGSADGGDASDGGDVPDTGAPLTEEMVPGSHVQVREARIDIGADYSAVVALLGAGTRSAAMNTRSYEWTLSNGVEVTVWFANTNLDMDDAPPNDVDGTDKVLWIIAQNFGGQTPDNIGVGSTRAAVEAAYGAAPNQVPIPNPQGTLAQYFTTGMLVAYEPGDTVRTITITRAYAAEPDGEIDVDSGRIRLSTGDIEGLTFPSGFPSLGTDQGDVESRLGTPDGQGTVTIDGQNLDMWSYAFIGIEVFFSDGGDRTLFVNVHTPYSGQTTGGQGIGSTRAEMESFLSSQGYDNGTTATNPALTCYAHGGDPDVGVTYDVNDLVTTITVPLLPDGECP